MVFIKYITCSLVKSVCSIGVGKALGNLQDLMWVLFYFTLISSVVTYRGAMYPQGNIRVGYFLHTSYTHI